MVVSPPPKVNCPMCGRLVDLVQDRLPVHGVLRKATSCPFGGRFYASLRSRVLIPGRTSDEGRRD